MAFTPQDFTADARLVLNSGVTVSTATTGVGATVDLGAAAYSPMDLVIDITAQDIAGTDDSAIFTLEGSTDNFATIAGTLVSFATGNGTALTTLLGGGNLDKGAGQHVIPVTNWMTGVPSSMPSAFRYLRLRHKTAGATVSLTYSARLVKRAPM